MYYEIHIESEECSNDQSNIDCSFDSAEDNLDDLKVEYSSKPFQTEQNQ